MYHKTRFDAVTDDFPYSFFAPLSVIRNFRLKNFHKQAILTWILVDSWILVTISKVVYQSLVVQMFLSLTI